MLLLVTFFSLQTAKTENCANISYKTSNTEENFMLRGNKFHSQSSTGHCIKFRKNRWL